MAKRRKSRKSRAKKAAASGGTTIANHGYSGRKFRCYGKHVRAGKSSKRVPRIFCAKAE